MLKPFVFHRHPFVLVTLMGVCLLCFSCEKAGSLHQSLDIEAIYAANQFLIDASIEDIYNPPVATRVFAYPYLAAYETYLHKHGQSLLTETADLEFEMLSDTTRIDYSLAAMIAFCKAAKYVVFSEYLVDSLRNDLLAQSTQAGISASRQKASIEYGDQISATILHWYAKDKYAQIKSDNYYEIVDQDSTWILTPPNYEQPLEPSWMNLRPLFIEDVRDFQPWQERPKFSTSKDSEFYRYAKEVYDQYEENTEEERNIAKHWDCNPNEFIQSGHNVQFAHRISPPGHWVKIAEVLCKQENVYFAEALRVNAAITSAMYDGIIACWYTKYTQQLIRPVTYINRHIDNTWLPYIQTPPFPEYTSGHSVVSGCSSSILEEVYPQTAFVDDTEVPFGLPKRKFASLQQAGQEASNSRLYGGIHYRYGVDHGLEQGQKIGRHVFQYFKK